MATPGHLMPQGHLTLSYYIDQNNKKINTPVNLYSIPYNSSLSVSTDALWDTGASMSAITPDIMNKLKVILLGDFALSNGNSQTLLSFAAPPFKEKIDFSKRQNEE